MTGYVAVAAKIIAVFGGRKNHDPQAKNLEGKWELVTAEGALIGAE